MSPTPRPLLEKILEKELENLVKETKQSLGQVKRVAASEAWKILQIIIAKIISCIEYNAVGMGGKDKKQIAMNTITQFYNNVFLIVDIPFVPPVFESIIHMYVKNFLLLLVSSSIDAMVITFRELGIFSKNKEIV